MNTFDLRAFADDLSRWSIIACAALVPFFFFLPATSAQAKMLVIALAVFISAISWGVARASDKVIRIPTPILAVLAVALPLAYFVSALFTGFRITSFVTGSGNFDTVVAVALLSSILVLIVFLFSEEKWILRGVYALISGTTALIVLQIIAFFAPSEMLSQVGGWYDTSILAGAMLLLAVSYFRHVYVYSRLRSVVLIFAAVAAMIFLIIANDRDIWIVLAALAAIFSIFQFRAAHMRENASIGVSVRHTSLWFALLSLSLACIFGQTFITVHTPTSIQRAPIEVRPSWQGTFQVGQNVLNSRQLVFGSGPNTFAYDWQKFKPTGVNVTNFWNVDFPTGVGLIPTAFVTAGLLGLVTWLLLYVLFLIDLCVLLVRRTGSALGIAIASAIVFLIIFTVVYVPGAGPMAALFLLLGFFISLQGNAGVRVISFGLNPETLGGIARYAGSIAVLLVILYTATLSLRATTSSILVTRARALATATTADINPDLNKPLALLGQAISLFPQNDDAQRAAAEIGLLQLSRLLQAPSSDSTAQERLKTTLAQTIQHGLAAVAINGGDYQNWFALANLYQNLAGAGVGDVANSAKSAYENAVKQNPTNPLPLIRLAQYYISQNDVKNARAVLDKAIALKPNLSAAYYLRSQVEVMTNNPTQALNDAKIAVQLAQDDALGWYNLGVILYGQSDYADSAIALRQAVNLLNNYANALFVLALADEKIDFRNEAIVAMQRVAQLNPTDKSIPLIIENLKAGRPALTSATSAPVSNATTTLVK